IKSIQFVSEFTDLSSHYIDTAGATLVFTNFDGLFVADITDPTGPVVLGSTTPSTNPNTSTNSSDIVIHDEITYVAWSTNTSHRIDAISLADPTSPTKIATAGNSPIRDMCVVNDRVYFTSAMGVYFSEFDSLSN